MSRDVYQPCPFCTDRKIKFCCADIADEMPKIMRQIDGGQQRAALKHLDKLAESHPDTVWNEMTRAMVLLEEERNEEALAILEHLHAKHPDHQRVAELQAGAIMDVHGYRAARELLWRALRKAHGPADLLCTLLCSLAAHLTSDRCYLAARQNLTVAMRLAPEKERQAIFIGLMEFDSDAAIPYPLRGVHSLRPLSGDSEREEAAHKASRLAERGCFGPAADRFAALAESMPGDAAAEYNAGLCRAWAGDQLDAAAAFIRAAKAESDFELAAEYAVLGQLLRALESEQTLNSRDVAFRIDSVDRVIGALEESPLAVRRPLPPSQDNEEMPEAVFELADRPIPDSFEEIAVEDCPRSIGFCIIQGPNAENHEPLLRLSCENAEDHDACEKILAGIIDTSQDGRLDDVTRPATHLYPEGFHAFSNSVALPASVPALDHRQLQNRLAEELAETWLRTPQPLLDRQTPEDAARQSERQAEVAGLLYLLDVTLFHQRLDADPGTYRARLGLPAIAPTSPQEDQSLHSFSTIQMHRVAVEDLDDRQLGIVMNRALLIHHWPFLRAVLQESLGRELPGFDKQRVFTTLSKLARDRGDTENALHWIEQGRQNVAPHEKAFMEIAEWDLRELGVRLDRGDSPEFQEYLRGIVSYYGPKLPEMVEIITTHVEQMGIEMPRVQTAGGDGVSGKAVWTPDQKSGSGQKLWLPGS